MKWESLKERGELGEEIGKTSEMVTAWVSIKILEGIFQVSLEDN